MFLFLLVLTTGRFDGKELAMLDDQDIIRIHCKTFRKNHCPHHSLQASLLDEHVNWNLDD